jgi:hypothetical protein
MDIILTSCTGNWTEITGSSIAPSGWINSASSFDGSHQYISTDKNIFYSFDSGNSWEVISQSFTGIKPKSLTVSSGGAIIGLIDNKNIQISFDSGNLWLNNIVTGGDFKNWKRLAFSFDAQYITTLGFDTEIYISSDSGFNWTTGSNAIKQNWSAIAMSSDGSIQLAAVKSGSLWRSNDFGLNWTNIITYNI